MKLFLIGVYGIAGVMARYGIHFVSVLCLPKSFPFGTLMINLFGSFLIGITYVLGVEHSTLSDETRTALMVGFLGGFTTFSTFSLESFVLLEKRSYGAAALYLLGSPTLGLLFTALGVVLVRNLLLI